MFKTKPEDFFKTAQENFSKLPKTTDELQELAKKAKNVIDVETANAQELISIYTKAYTGDASVNEIAAANKKLKELAVATRFAALMYIPGAALMVQSLPADFIPASVKKEFGI